MPEQKVFQASPEAKAKAGQFRMFAILMWAIAIAAEVFAILKLIHDDTLVWLIVTLVGMLILVVVANILWKKANKLDPPSEANKVAFFLKSQLGAILSVAAFFPIVIFIFTNKDASKKTKGIAGAIAIMALLIAGISGIDTNPASIEKYTKQINEQTDSLMQLTGKDHVYWLGEAGKVKDSSHKYHIYEDCRYLKGKTNIQEGSIKDAFGNNGESELCKICKARAEKEKADNGGLLQQVADKVQDVAGKVDSTATNNK